MNKDIKPTTITGIKRLAKEIAKDGIKHATALDLASVKAGFQNYAHALKEGKR